MSSSSSCRGQCTVPDYTQPCEKTCACGCGCCCASASQTSDSGIRFSNGEIQLSVSDASAGGFGLSWGHRRTYSNRLSQNKDFNSGYNWLMDQLPYATEEANGNIAVVFSPRRAFWFEKTGATYSADFGGKQTLAHAGSVFQFVETDGTVWEFHDFDQTAHAGGSFKKATNPGGQVAEVIASIEPQGFVVSTRVTGGGYEEFWNYTNVVGADGQNRIVTLTVRRGPAGSPQNVSLTEYSYHDGSDAHGSVVDLKTVIHYNWDGAAWVETGRYYYRYYKDAAGGVGFQHGLKYIVNPESYARMQAASLNPLTASDAQLAPYADDYFEYNTERRVTKAKVAAGSMEYTYNYTASGLTDAYNTWHRKTVETRADGSKVTVYSNHIGQVILRELSDGAPTPKRWIEHFRYDSDGREIEHAQPSAINMAASPIYDETQPELNVQLKPSDGLIHLRTYYTVDDPITSGGSGTGTGAAKGYEEFERVKKGSSVAPINLRIFQYTSNTTGGNTVYLLARETAYRNDDGTGEIVTRHEYTWHAATNQVQQQTTTLPVIPTTQNGPGGTTGPQVRELFDVYGNMTARQDQRGYITTYQFDTAKGVMTTMVQDDDPPAGSGWTANPYIRLKLTTDYEYDAQGRQIQSLGSSHDVDLSGMSTTIRTASWTVYWDDLDEVWTGQGFASGTAPNYSYTLVNPVSITHFDGEGRTIETKSAVRATTAGKLSPTDSFPQSSWVRWSKSNYDNGGDLVSTQVYHTIPASGGGSEGTNFDTTTYGQDAMRRQNKVRTPGGTITRTVFDVRGLAIKTYVGTDDTGATDNDPDGSGSPNNMVIVPENEYDFGLEGGDGNLTKTTLYVDSVAANNRVTEYRYDFRDRRTTTITNDGTYTVHTVDTLDNLDRATVMEQKHETTPNTFVLIGKSETLFDERGQVYRTKTYSVNPSDGTIGAAATSENWYDAAGTLIKTLPAGSGRRFTKTIYDGVGRAFEQYVGYYVPAGLEPYSEVGIITSSNRIFEQTFTSYDNAGNVILTTSFQRWHTSTGEGVLNAPWAGIQPKARVTYLANWHDAIGRTVATADYGTNSSTGGNDPLGARPATIPASSDTVLVSRTRYNDRGETEETTDPAGIVNRTEYDHASRQIKTIHNYVSGGSQPDQNLTVEMTYTADGNLKTLTAKNPTTGDQTTTYEYGTDLFDDYIATSNLLIAEAYPDIANVADKVRYRYNRQGQPFAIKDQRASDRQFVFDKAGRVLHDRVVTLGLGTVGPVRRISRTYDVRGLLDTITSYTSEVVGSGTVLNQVKLLYNGLGQLMSEQQEHSGAVLAGSPNVQYTYLDGTDNLFGRSTIVYPDGKTFTYGYWTASAEDYSLARVSYLLDSANMQTPAYSYLGLNTVVQTKAFYSGGPNRVIFDLVLGTNANNPYGGLDQFGRVTELVWRSEYGTPAELEHLQYGYDRAGNRKYRRNVLAGWTALQDELYGYDGAHRLIDYDRGTLNTGNNTMNNLAISQDWTLDKTGNWSRFQQDDNADNTKDVDHTRTQNKANEITAISTSLGTPWTNPAYDLAGNMTTVPKPTSPSSAFTAKYDAWNRLTTLTDGATPVAEYRYDGLNRRVTKLVGSDTRHYYYSDQWQVLEERLNLATTMDRQFLWGIRYVDDLVRRERASEFFFALQDANFNLTAIADWLGAVQERYNYTAYGVPQVLTSAFAARASSLYDWETQYAGYSRDHESGLYQARLRILGSSLGIWLTRDWLPYEYLDCNLYQFDKSNPVNHLDPWGIDYHHWLPQLGQDGEGQRFVERLCCSKGINFHIDEFTTFFDAGIRGKVGSPTRTAHSALHYMEHEAQYVTIGKAIYTLSKTCCQMLTSFEILIHTVWTYLEVLDGLGRIQPRLPAAFNMVDKHSPDRGVVSVKVRTFVFLAVP